MIKELLLSNNLLSHLQNLIAPPRCMGCLQENTWLCRTCNLNRPSFTPICIVCKEDSPRGTTCRGCNHATSLHGVVNAGPYGSPVLRRGIHWLKFKNIKTISFPLSQMLIMPLLNIRPLPVLQESAVLIPIPLHRKKENQRGFNQSLAIAENLSRLTQIPVYDILHRQKHTLTQTKLPLALREKNTHNAFILKKPLPKNTKFIIILDDVTTSGSTLSAAAQAIQKEADQEIWGLTVAQG